MDSLRLNNEIMKNGSVDAQVGGLFKTITRTYNDNSLIFATNFNVKSYQATVEFPKDGIWYNISGGGTVEVSGGVAKITFAAGQTMIFSFDSNDVRQDISTPVSEVIVPKVNLNIYPNPTTDFFRISSDNILNDISVYSSNGNLVKMVKKIQNNDYDLNVSGLEAGMYILSMRSGKQIVNRKVIIEK